MDKLVTGGFSVLAPPLVIAFDNDPVFERLRFLTRDATWRLGPGGFDGAWDDMSEALHLPLPVFEMYPFVGDIGILVRVMEGLEVADEEADELMVLLEAWLDTFAERRGRRRLYRVAPVGRESTFESWLEGNLSQLAEFGYPIRVADREADGIAGRQARIDRTSIADLVCVFTEDGEGHSAGDWLVVENKVTAVGQAALHQLARYVDLLPSAVNAEGVRVHGLLIADGASVNLRRGLRERSFGYLSLSQIGYRDVARHQPLVLQDEGAEGDETAIPYPTSQALTTDLADRAATTTSL